MRQAFRVLVLSALLGPAGCDCPDEESPNTERLIDVDGNVATVTEVTTWTETNIFCQETDHMRVEKSVWLQQPNGAWLYGGTFRY